VGSEAEVGNVALRNDGLCTEARVDGLRSRIGAAEGADPEFDSLVDSEEWLDTDFGRSRTVGEGGSALSDSLSSSSASA